VADAHIGRPSARLKADLAAEATTLAQSFFRHLTHIRNVHSKAAGACVRNRRLCLSAPNNAELSGSAASSGLSNRSTLGRSAFVSGPDPAIIHLRFAVWYKLGCGNRSAVAEPYPQKFTANQRGLYHPTRGANKTGMVRAQWGRSKNLYKTSSTVGL